MPVQNGMGSPALDFYYCVNGCFVGIETKRKGGKPTPRQLQTIADIEHAGGIAGVVDDEDSMMRLIERLMRATHGRMM